jgi:tRNA(Ile)-lysidine synthase
MKYVLAVSGGVDSVVLLDKAARGELDLPAAELVVAHFDHGMRPDSAGDAEFVEKLTLKYQIKFMLGLGQLAQDASEQLAREQRYDFLRTVAGDGLVVTAHHQDDLIETILINLLRGTGWRGLAPMWSADIVRPLLGYSKAELVDYAIKHRLEWVEDETNYSQRYFRNRVRDKATRLSVDARRRLLEQYDKQSQLRHAIESILSHLPLDTGQYQLDGVLQLPETVAIEVLNKLTRDKLTTPQLNRLLKQFSRAKSGDIFQPGGKIQVGIYRGGITFFSL